MKKEKRHTIPAPALSVSGSEGIISAIKGTPLFVTAKIAICFDFVKICCIFTRYKQIPYCYE